MCLIFFVGCDKKDSNAYYIGLWHVTHIWYSQDSTSFDMAIPAGQYTFHYKADGTVDTHDAVMGDESYAWYTSADGDTIFFACGDIYHTVSEKTKTVLWPNGKRTE